MKYQLSVTERINAGNYEFIEVQGSVEFEEDETEGQDPSRFAHERLDVLLLSHRRRALALVPEDADSLILHHPALES